MSGPIGDTMQGIDERYRLCESDATMTHNFEAFGKRRINVAIVGVGRMGAIHLYNILREPRANLIYLIDTDQTKLDFLDKKYFLQSRGVKILLVKDWLEVALKDKSLEAVLIAAPTNRHEYFVRTALEHDKHVLCEKPLAASLGEIDSVVKLAASRNLKLICAFNRRYDPSFRFVADQIKRGEIGPLQIIKTCSRDSPLPPLEYIKICGGVFHDSFVHDLDNITWYANDLPIEVFARGHAFMEDYKNLKEFDSTFVWMKYASGLMSMTDLARFCASGYEQRVEVLGPKGVLKVDELTRAGWEKHSEKGVTRPSQCYSFASRYSEAYSNEITELFNHIEGNQTAHPIKTGYLQALCKILTACEESSHSGKPVKLEWTAEERASALNQ